MLPPEIALLVVAAAVIHATWNAFVKSSRDPLLFLTAHTSAGALLGLVGVVILPLPHPDSWPYLAASLAIYCVHYATLLGAYRHGDLSQIYPIARGSGPLFAALLSAPIAGEYLGLSGMIGVAAISLGIVSLGLRRNTAPWRGIVLALATGLTIAAYAFTDGLGVRRAGEPLSYIVWIMALQSAPLVFVSLLRRRPAIAGFLRAEGLKALASGTLGALGFGLAIWAYSRAAIAPVAALRETSVIFAAIIGTRLMGEPFGLWRLGAASTVAFGIALLNFYR